MSKMLVVFNGPAVLNGFLEDGLRGAELLKQLLLSFRSVFYENLSQHMNGEFKKYSINDVDEAMHEVLCTMDIITDVYIEFEDYKPHFERMLALLMEVAEKRITDLSQLKGFEEHKEQVSTFLEEMRTSDKYRDNWPISNDR